MGVVAHDPVDRAEVTKMIGIVTPSAATADDLGSVYLAAAQADVTAATITAAPAGGTGDAAGAYDTAAHRDTAIAAINSLITEVAELTTVVNGLLAKLRTAGVLAAE